MGRQHCVLHSYYKFAQQSHHSHFHFVLLSHLHCYFIIMGRTAKIVVATEAGGVCNFEVDSAETIENIKALIEVEV